MPNLSRNVYDLPLNEQADLTEIIHGSPAHEGALAGAIDYVVPVRTVVTAPLDGTVVRVIDGHTRYGNDKKYADSVNFIEIEHAQGERSQLLHLAAGSLAVKLGEAVELGQPLAKTGLSGWLSKPQPSLVCLQAR